MIYHVILVLNNNLIMGTKSLHFLHFDSCKLNSKHYNNNNKNYKQYNNKHNNNNNKNCISSDITPDGMSGCSTLQKLFCVINYVFQIQLSWNAAYFL